MPKTESDSKPRAPSVIAQFKAARKCSTPLVAVTTPDQWACIEEIVAAMNGKTPVIQWDTLRGFMGRNEEGARAKHRFAQENFEGHLGPALKQAESMPEGCVLIIVNAHRHLDDPMQIQGVLNLRDGYKTNKRTLVLVGPGLTLPSELQGDIVSFDEPLPGPEQLGKIIKGLHSASGIECHAETCFRAVEAVQGLSAFAAEQQTAIAMIPETGSTPKLDLDLLWERKRQQIEQTPGLSVSREGIKFADLGGLEVLKDYLRALLGGKSRPNAICWLDEIEKMLAGMAGDTSGVSQDQLGGLLTYMQDKRATGVMLVGIPGGGKSAAAKAAGNEAGVPTVRLDMGAMKGSLVGQSEQQLRTALKVIDSVSNGSAMFIATCNSLAGLPPELRRRFRAGTFYLDLPDSKEREAIWKVHRKRYEIKASDTQPDDEGWTGAEIEQCAELAWRLGRPLNAAAKYVVPISQSAPEKISALRDQADGRWLSASHPGVYRKATEAVAYAKVGRNMQLED